MALQDRVQEQTNEAKNALEAYVYSLRNKMYDALSEFVTDDWKESTSKQLEQMEVWMPAECAMVGPPQVLEQAVPSMMFDGTDVMQPVVLYMRRYQMHTQHCCCFHRK